MEIILALCSPNCLQTEQRLGLRRNSACHKYMFIYINIYNAQVLYSPFSLVFQLLSVLDNQFQRE